MGPTHPVRLGVARIVDDRQFDNVVLVLIIGSSVMLALDSPFNDPNGRLATTLGEVNLVMTILFTLEMMTKIIATGFIYRPKSYMRSGWNVLDFITVIVSLMALAVGNAPELTALRSIRAMRVLRPLRMIRRVPGLRKIVDVLLTAIPAALNVMAVCGLFFLIFAIFCVEYLKGDLRSCQGDIVDEVIAPNEARACLPTHPSQASLTLHSHLAPRRTTPIYSCTRQVGTR